MNIVEVANIKLPPLCNNEPVAICNNLLYICNSNYINIYDMNIYDLKNKEISLLATFDTGHEFRISDIKLYPDTNNDWIFTCSFDNTIKLFYHCKTCVREIKQFIGHTQAVTCLVINQLGDEIFTGSYDKTIKQWNIDSGYCIATFTGHKSKIWSILLNNDRLYSASNDGTIICWNTDTFEKIATMIGHKESVHSICFVNLNTIASASNDGKIKFWDITNWKCTKQFKLSRAIQSIYVVGGGLYLIAPSFNGIFNEIHIWDIETKKLVFHSSQKICIGIYNDGNIIMTVDKSHLQICYMNPHFPIIIKEGAYRNPKNTIRLYSDGTIREFNQKKYLLITQIDSLSIIKKISNTQFVITNRNNYNNNETNALIFTGGFPST